ncbi:MAG: histidine--tRNA ligase [Chthonomonadaceae bacterium]|nr:histidine--tRNA ligase [Chthonomonadaceae bacterium]
MRFQAPRGTEDVLPGDSYRRRRLENEFLALAERYGYREIRTPVFEDTELFVRSSGETSDIVTKQMYTFLDKGDRSLTLKPEGTAPAMRAVIEHNLCPPGSVARLSYVTQIFRYERPQKGRLRQAHQVGLELVGSEAPEADAEVIELTVRFYERLGLEATVLLNSLGRETCRAAYREALLAFAKPLLQDLPEEVRARAEANPLRLMDSKDPKMIAAMAEAPTIETCWEPEARERHERVVALLDEAGVRHGFEPALVRGLDYYTETVFEVQSEAIGAQSALCGGGRYDGLVKELGGPATPAVGVAMGIERALLAMEAAGVCWSEPGADAFAIAMPGCEGALRDQVRALRADGIRVLVDLEARSFNAQLRQAGKSGARFAMILGDDELASGTATLRDLASGEQRQVPFDEVARTLRETIG